MLRRRPDCCPYCGHDVRGDLRCGKCQEVLPDAANDVSREPPISGVGGTVRAVLGGTAAVAGIAAVGVASLPLAIGVAIAAPFAVGIVASWWRNRPRSPDLGPPSNGESLLAARATLTASPDAVVSVRGRVRIEIPVREGSDDAVRDGYGGRFLLETTAGDALVDDDGVLAGPELRVRDGDLVEVTGPARLVNEPASSSDYRGIAASRVVFDGTSARPLEVRAL